MPGAPGGAYLALLHAAQARVDVEHKVVKVDAESLAAQGARDAVSMQPCAATRIRWQAAAAVWSVQTPRP